MNRVFLSLLFYISFATTMFAAKSAGTVRYVQQPDGTTLAVQLLGDEHFNWYQTTDGVILKEEDKAFYVAQTSKAYGFSMLCDVQSLPSSHILAHDLALRTPEEEEAIASQDRDSYFSAASYSLQSKQASSDMLSYIEGYPTKFFSPHNGKIRIPIILMNYSDVKFTCGSTTAIDSATVHEIFDEYFNGTTKTPYTSATRFYGYGSVGQYFRDASNGNFEPVFELYGPYTADYNHDHYGYNQGQSAELSLLEEAVKKADGDIDFTQYDSNGDKDVDIVYIVYAGTGANLSADKNDFWPACWYSIFGNYASADGMYIKVLGGANELSFYASQYPTTFKNNQRAGIGVFCHEMSHGLGMPDLYWTTTIAPKDAQGYVDYNNCGPEDWDLMDGGENLYNAMWPCQYNAWAKDLMGWLDVEELTEPQTITIYPLNKEGGKAYRITNPNNAREYYIIENYQYDEWNSYVNNKYDSGLMIWHINTTVAGLNMHPNNTYGTPSVTILPADGYILAAYSYGKTFVYKDSLQTMPGRTTNEWTTLFREDAKGDPYPGSQGVTSLAAYKNYTGTEMVDDYAISDITKNSDGSITFKFMGGTPSGLAGDADNNGEVNHQDAFTVMNRMLGKSVDNLSKKQADINEDGKISVADANQITNAIAK